MLLAISCKKLTMIFEITIFLLFFRWVLIDKEEWVFSLSSLYFPKRISDQLNIEKMHPTLIKRCRSLIWRQGSLEII